MHASFGIPQAFSRHPAEGRGGKVIKYILEKIVWLR